jgi:hypothetical protein
MKFLKYENLHNLNELEIFTGFPNLFGNIKTPRCREVAVQKMKNEK